jgi:hypothetical protein
MTTTNEQRAELAGIVERTSTRFKHWDALAKAFAHPDSKDRLLDCRVEAMKAYYEAMIKLHEFETEHNFPHQ